MNRIVRPATWLLLPPAAAAALAAVAAGVAPPRALVLLVLAPLVEEIVFRLGLQEALLRRGWNATSTTVLTALVFAAVHVAVRGNPAAAMVVLPALLLGAVYARTRRVVPCVVLHAVMNAVWLAWGLAGTP